MSITFYGDENAEMTRIEKDGVVIFEGNYWDLPQDPKRLVQLLGNLGFKAEFKPYKYDD